MTTTLTPRQEQVLSALRGHDTSEPGPLADELGISVTSLRTHLRALVRARLVEATGETKARRYRAVPQPGDRTPLPSFPGVGGGRPLTSSVLDVLARARRAVGLDELARALSAPGDDVAAAVRTLWRRGRVAYTVRGDVLWLAPAREMRA